MTVRPNGARPISVAHVALFLPWITAIVAARLPIRDNSFLWHVTAGRLQVESGAVLTADPFSFTFGGETWRTQSWLLELGYSLADGIIGLNFVMPFLGACGALTFGFVLLVVYRATGSVEATAIVGVLTAWLAAAFLSPRPVVVSYLLFALVVAAAGQRRLHWTLPLIAWVWASVHGSFILGVGFVVLLALRNRDRGLARAATMMVLAVSLTAHGLALWEILLEFARSQSALDLITEWATPDLTGIPLIPFSVGILLLMVAAMGGRLKPADMWIVAPFLIFAFTATRAVFPAWLALAPFVGGAFSSLRATERDSGQHRRVMVGISTVLVALPFLIPVDPGPLSEDFPAEAVDQLGRGPVFHDDYVGGFIVYARGPELQVFVDDRAELYGADHLGSMTRARSGSPVWREIFDRWGVEQALIRQKDGLADVLLVEGWRRIAQDGEFVLLIGPG